MALQNASNVNITGGIIVADVSLTVKADAGFFLRDGAIIPVEGVRIRVLSAPTTEDTPTEMTVNGISLVVGNNSIHAYVIYVAAKCTGGAGGNAGKAAFFKIEVLVKSPGGVTEIIGGELKSVVANDMDGVWDVNVEVSPGKLMIMVTGGATDAITWVGWVSETTLA